MQYNAVCKLFLLCSCKMQCYYEFDIQNKKAKSYNSQRKILSLIDTHNVNILVIKGYLFNVSQINVISRGAMGSIQQKWTNYFLHIRGRGSQYQNLTSSICSSVHLLIIQLFVCHFTWLFSCQFVCLFIPQIEHPLFHSLGFLFDLFSCASFFVYLCPYVSIGLHKSI